MHYFTAKEKEFIEGNARNRSNIELTEMFNKNFGSELGINQIKAFKKNNKISSGLNGQFSKGHIPSNKGKKGFGGWELTQFKKGNKPHNWVPIGSERITKDGYIQVKIQDGKFQHNWRGKHILIWEEHNGSLPDGYAIIFGDGNNRNFNLDNLILVSRNQLLTLNRKGLIQNDADLTRTAVVITDIYHKISQKQKQSTKKGV